MNNLCYTRYTANYTVFNNEKIVQINFSAETYQEAIKEINPTVQLELDGWECFLQHMHPATVFIIAWAIIRANADIRPRANAGLLGYTHSPPAVALTSEACTVENQLNQHMCIWPSSTISIGIAKVSSMNLLQPSITSYMRVDSSN